MTVLSVLDLSPITEGGGPSQSMRSSLDLARRAEALGYRRYWVAEHHNIPGIASAATAVVIGHIAGGTSTIRVGAGGIMLPNHAPLVIAEQFGTLDALHPGRIDLGLGRAPGTDQRTAFALRRNLEGHPDDFPRDVLELQGYFRETGEDEPVQAIPGRGRNVPIWILGSSLYGAQLAAMLGLPYAFASHFAPGALLPALDTYRRSFRPSEQLAEPYAMAGFNVFAADTDEEAHRLRTSARKSTLWLRQGRPRPLPRPTTSSRKGCPRSSGGCSTSRAPAPRSAPRPPCSARWRSSSRGPASTSSCSRRRSSTTRRAFARSRSRWTSGRAARSREPSAPRGR